jgi:biopolymer transport protein ExbB/TolQ
MEPRKLCQLQLNQFRSQKQYDEQMLKHNELADEAIVREKKLNATENELKEATANNDNLMKEIENQCRFIARGTF